MYLKLTFYIFRVVKIIKISVATSWYTIFQIQDEKVDQRVRNKDSVGKHFSMNYKSDDSDASPPFLNDDNAKVKDNESKKWLEFLLKQVI